MKIRKSTIIVHVIAWSIALFWVLPFLGVFMAAIRPFKEIVYGWWRFEEFNPSLNFFAAALNNPSYPMSRGIINSFLIAVPSTIIPLLVASLTAYGFTRFSFPLKDYLFIAIVFLMSVPQQMMVIPLFSIMKDLGLLNTHLGLILIHSSWGLAWIIFFMKNYFSILPVDVEEAAMVDGASYFKIFYKIVLPMAVPALISAAVLQFTWVWNDFFFALMFLYDPHKMVATQCLSNMKGELHFDWQLLSAGSIIVMIVPVLIYALLQKYYIRGMIGWVRKG
ncbi:carbohydrate ABC transporter permease [Candidatus Bathyarchaeota archaeon]|mgnify:CR=1 FL=1|nr:MAG: carbohydrate ABC transporter permease [Candidatus Bathyarchaeota archaeon]